MIFFDTADENRFIRSVKSGGTDECWPYTGGTNTDGYGFFYALGTRFLAHRVAYSLVHGDVGEMLVCHTCDNPICCNPNHLFLGTSQDNVRDSVAKGRHSSKTLFGESRPNSALTESQVLEIRNKRRLGRTLQALGREYNVHLSTIHQIVTRKTWNHI